MIAKGTPHDNGLRLARYLVTGKEGEIAALWELSGFASTDIVEAFRSVHVMAAATRCLQPFFHVQVRNRDTEILTRDQWLIVADRIERVLGLAGQPRALAFHTECRTGSEHMHLAFSRIDHETLTARKLPFFKRRLIKVSRELEAALGLSPVNAERTSAIKYAPLRPEEEQARRLGVNIREVLESIRECFDRSDCCRSFVAALTHSHLTLAKGERRDFIVVDQAGGIHALGKRILGVSAAQIRARLSDLHAERLPTVDQVRQRIAGEQGSRKNKLIEKNQGARQEQLIAPAAPGIEVGSRIVKPAEEMEDQPRLTAVPATAVVTDLQHDPVSPEIMPYPRSETTIEIPFESLSLSIPNLESEVTAASVSDAATSTQPPDPVPVDKVQPSDQGKRAGLAEILKKQFRAAVQTLFKRLSSPQPQARRRRKGETVAGFQSAARNLLRPIVRLPGFNQAVAFLNGALPWLHLWDWNDTAEHVAMDVPPGTDGDHLSPHP